MELTDAIRDNGEAALIFTQYVSMGRFSFSNCLSGMMRSLTSFTEGFRRRNETKW